MPPTILFLSDFGHDDPFVGICHAVIASRAPGVRVIDLSHGIPPGDVRAGALALAEAVPYLPKGAVLLAVVDPSVGTARRAVGVQDEGGTLSVGPDNGLLSLAWAGGAARAVEITSPKVVLRPTSATFHGRDVFAPAAAHLASGRSFEDLGPVVSTSSLIRLEDPRAVSGPEGVDCEVLGVDRFGNVRLSARPSDVPGWSPGRSFFIVLGEMSLPARAVSTFAEAGEGEPAILVDSSGRLALVIAGGSASERLALRPGARLLLRPLEG